MPLIAIKRRHGWLVLVTGLHLAMLACWRFAPSRTAPRTPQSESELIFLTQVLARQPKAELPKLSAPATAAPRPRRNATPAPEPVMPTSQPPDPTAASDPFAQAAPVVESVLERSRRAAIGVDRELRKESKNDNDRVLVRESKFAQDLALAYKGSGAFSMAETVLPNGDSLARVTTPFGSYCLLKRGNRDHAGLNATDNAGKTLIIRCPN